MTFEHPHESNFRKKEGNEHNQIKHLNETLLKFIIINMILDTDLKRKCFNCKTKIIISEMFHVISKALSTEWGNNSLLTIKAYKDTVPNYFSKW